MFKEQETRSKHEAITGSSTGQAGWATRSPDSLRAARCSTKHHKHRVDKLSPEQNNRQFLSRGENLKLQTSPDAAEHSAAEIKVSLSFTLCSWIKKTGHLQYSASPNCPAPNLWSNQSNNHPVVPSAVPGVSPGPECPQTRTRVSTNQDQHRFGWSRTMGTSRCV